MKNLKSSLSQINDDEQKQRLVKMFENMSEQHRKELLEYVKQLADEEAAAEA